MGVSALGKMIVQSDSTVNHLQSISTSNLKIKMALEILYEINFCYFITTCIIILATFLF